MNLIKRWRGHDQPRGGQPIVRRKQREDDWGLSRLRQEMDKAFERVWREFGRGWPASTLARMPGLLSSFRGLAEWPAIDMAEDEKNLTLRVDVPGLDPKDLDIEVSGNLLTIRGQREDEWSQTRAGVYRRERRSGSFARTITLPNYVEPDKVQAKYEKGILTITIPKIPGKGPKRVKVTS